MLVRKDGNPANPNGSPGVHTETTQDAGEENGLSCPWTPKPNKAGSNRELRCPR